MKKKFLGSIALTLCLALACVVPAFADARKVVTLGQDLTEDQMNTMMRYFGVGYNDVDLLYINNQNERDHLGSYVPLEQIGNYTYSCALVAPTSSGGIQVKTANLTWVTCNMIASTLSTSGVTNCQVVAAAPFKVSGTGALTGVIMAYEQASKKTLEPQKVELANQELVTTGNLSNEVGQSKATAIINETKIKVIENNVTNIEEITNIVNNVSSEYDVTINEDQSAEIAELMQKIAEQEYDITQLKATLDRVQANVIGDAGASEEEVEEAQKVAEASEQAAKEATEAQADEELPVSDDDVVIVDGEVDDNFFDEDEVNILENTDPDALDDGTGSISEVDTTQTVQEQETEIIEEEDPFGIPEATDDGTITEIEGPQESETIAAETPQTDVLNETELTTEAAPAEVTTEAEAAVSVDTLSEDDKTVYEEVKTALGETFEGGILTAENGTQVYLSDEAVQKVPEAVENYLLNVLSKGAQAVEAEEAADPSVNQNIVAETQQEAPDKQYTEEDLKQVDKFVRRLAFEDSENILASSMLEEGDKVVLYDALMAILEEAYGVEPEAFDETEAFGGDEMFTETEVLDGSAEDNMMVDPATGENVPNDEFADFEEAEGTF